MGLRQNTIAFHIQPQALEKMLKVEEAKAAPSEDADFGIQAFDKATGQAVFEKIRIPTQ